MTSASVAAVYEFLRDRNAPFNVQLLVDNLQTKKVKKSQVEKALATLVTEGKVTRKEFGKTKIYFLAQANLEKATTEELTSLKGRAAELKNDVSSERQMLSSRALCRHGVVATTRRRRGVVATQSRRRRNVVATSSQRRGH